MHLEFRAINPSRNNPTSIRYLLGLHHQGLGIDLWGTKNYRLLKPDRAKTTNGEFIKDFL